MPDRNKSPTVTKQSLVEQRRYSLSPKKRKKFPSGPSQRLSDFRDASELETKKKNTI